MVTHQQTKKCEYFVPALVSLEDTLRVCKEFLGARSGRVRTMALSSALLKTTGERFHLLTRVQRATRRNIDPYAVDLECFHDDGAPSLAVEVKNKALTLSDLEFSLKKARLRKFSELFLLAPRIRSDESDAIMNRVRQARNAGDNLYIFDFLVLARAALALGGESIRIAFLTKVGQQLDDWNTQPSHRQAWRKLLDSLG